MQHSNKLRNNRIWKVILFFIGFLIINDLLCVLMEPMETSSELMLTKYSKRVCESEIDTVIIGNSVTSMIDDKEFSNITGIRAFNMGTPSQSFSMSKDALMMAARQNKLKQVILMTGFESFEKDTENIPERAYEKVIISSYPTGKRILYRFLSPLKRAVSQDNIKQPASINAFFTWIDNCVDYFPIMCSNFRGKTERLISGHRLGQDIAFDLDREIYKTELRSMTEADERLHQEDITRLNSLNLPKGTIDEKSLEDLDEITVFCRNNGLKLYYFISAHQASHMERYGERYQDISNFLSQFMSKRDAIYYNFENDPAVHKQLPDSYFSDWEHVDGAHVIDATDVIAETFVELNQ